MIRRYIAMLLALACLIGMTAQPSAALAAPAGDKAGSTITVTGHAELTVVPDIAYITAGIVTTGADVETARRDNERAMRRIIDAVIAQGIDKSKIATSQFSLQPIYKNDGLSAGAISGYRLVNNLTVAVEDLDRIGQVIDAAFQAGANQFQGLRFAVRDDGKLRDELLRRAVQDGWHKASVIADALGVTLGQPLQVSEGGRYGPVQADTVRAFKANASAPIEAGTLTVGIDVNLVFGI
jgi:uncharacterized protein YggE